MVETMTKNDTGEVEIKYSSRPRLRIVDFIQA